MLTSLTTVGVDPFGIAIAAAEHAPAATAGAAEASPRTATYNAMLDAQGELLVAVADMAIQSHLTPRHLVHHAHVEEAIKHASVRWVALPMGPAKVTDVEKVAGDVWWPMCAHGSSS